MTEARDRYVQSDGHRNDKGDGSDGNPSDDPHNGLHVTRAHELEARFDVFPSACTVTVSPKLERLIEDKLFSGKFSTQTPWHRVFVKDDNGCNGVGMYVFDQHEARVTGTPPQQKHEFPLSLKCRKAPPSNDTSRALGTRLLLHEGIPTSLRNERTGHMHHANTHICLHSCSCAIHVHICIYGK